MFEDFSKVNHATVIQLLTFIKKEWEGEEEEEKTHDAVINFHQKEKKFKLEKLL